MNIRLKFYGGAQSVTGSKYLLETDNEKIMVDCGLFQGLKELRLRNWSPIPLPAEEIDSILLTHAHIDHSGYLPRLVKEGFNGPVYCTHATASLLDILLKDTAKLQEEEAAFAKKKGYSKHHPPLPLFGLKEVEQALGLLHPVPYGEAVQISDRFAATFLDAGHILGSASIVLQYSGNNQKKKIVFSGDIGRYNQPLLKDPTDIGGADILLMESTYGDRSNKAQDITGELANIVNEAFQRGGCVLIPSFAVGRTQLMLYYFHYLLEHQLIPDCDVYIDSPMAISATRLHKVHREDHRLSVNEHAESSIFDYPKFKYYRTQESSMNLNALKSGSIIISASGMCTGGRILHHLYHRLPREQDTLLFAGFQAEGTRGRKILDGEPLARIFGQDVPVKCQIRNLEGLSAHADMDELMRWAKQFKKPPKMTFIVHGEPSSTKSFSEKIKTELAWPNVIVPHYLESFELFTSI